MIMWLTDSVPSCLDKTRPWYAAAAAAGDADAQYNLAKDLLRPDEGGGTPPDAPRARELLQRAAEQGHFVAQNDLGALLLEGAAGVARDAAEAERWIGASAAQACVAQARHSTSSNPAPRALPDPRVLSPATGLLPRAR